jgi:hypothetical protein
MHETTVSVYVNLTLFVASTVVLWARGESFLFFVDFNWHSYVMMALLGVLVIIV